MGTQAKTICITGASSGIGEALAEYYAASGIKLVLTGRDKGRLEAVGDKCRRKGADVLCHVIDVADRQGMERFLMEVDDVQEIDLVIANAGISGAEGVMSGEDPVRARDVFDVNVYGVLNTIEPLRDRMVARKRGQIAIMSSLAGFRGWPGAPAYGASKAAVKSYGESLRGQLAEGGVKVNVICPGFVESRMTAVNKFRMPFLMTADKAARIIACGLEKNKGRIAFPFQTYFIVWFISCLPDALAHVILLKTPRKSEE